MKTRLLFLFLFMATISALPSFARETVVEVKTVQAHEFAWRLPVQGSVKSIHEARVSPRIPGPIETIFVEEGDEVEAGVTRLFQIDSTKLLKNVEIRKQELAISRYSLKEKQARLKQAEADYDKATIDLKRGRRLWEDNSISMDNLENIQLKHRMSELTVEHARAVIDLAGEQLIQAELAVGIAEKDYADSRVYAPINGRVVSKLQEAGEMSAPGKPIIVLKDPELVEVVAHLPAEYYHKIIPGSTTALISNGAANSVEADIYFKSPVINPVLRTFHIKCRLPRAKTTMIPGELANIVVIILKRKGLAVPVEAILQRSGKQVIFIAGEKKAQMIEVETGLENDGLTEVISQQLKEGSQVIVRGQYMLEDQQNIHLREGD